LAPLLGETPAKAEKRDAAKGLVLSEIQFKPLDWFKYNPDNEIFRKCKNEDYFRGLRKDIEEAGAILNPLIAMPDGLIIEGESRHIIASELFASGNAVFARLPARIILSGISTEKITERLYLGNLSRFEVPYPVRLIAYAKIWPGYFLSDNPEGGGGPTRKEIAAAAGLSESQVKRNKNVLRKAAEIAETEKSALSVKHIEKAQEAKKAEAGKQKAEKDFYEYSPQDKFVKAAVILLFEKNEHKAMFLLLNHFLRKKDREAFYRELPDKINFFIKNYFSKKER
jgi:hypothetical protein